MMKAKKEQLFIIHIIHLVLFTIKSPYFAGYHAYDKKGTQSLSK